MEIIKEVQGKYYLSISTTVAKGVQYTNFIECDEKGNVEDFDGNGRVDGFTIKCKLKKGEKSIDVSKLSDECFLKEIK